MKKFHSLLGIEQLQADDVSALLRLARKMQGRKSRPLLRDRRIALLFYEPSTRTRVSFEFAAKALGAMTTLVTASASSIEKGESLVDTGLTLQATGADAIILRHPSSGAPYVLARRLEIPIINAGDGMHEHPTQGLLDAFTILQHKKNLRGLKVAIVGDVFHSRVARSNVLLLTMFGAQVWLAGPPALVPDVAAQMAKGVRVTRHVEEALRGADVVMVLRVQKERLAGRQLRLDEYISSFQVTSDRLRLARRDSILMHPGPMNRGLELAGDLADIPQSVISEQVANGVAVRLAVLARALGAA
ncbi:MAG: aspartate carbamoyltransferase catalytic subunit [Acidobacteria bacterium]|nr:aspartate carbamoyltransferase catalytic subunit [Acidobacteriota bacterium]